MNILALTLLPKIALAVSIGGAGFGVSVLMLLAGANNPTGDSSTVPLYATIVITIALIVLVCFL